MGVCAFSNLAPVGPARHQNVRSVRAGILFIHCFLPGTWTTEHLTHAGHSVNVCGMNEATWKHVALRGGGVSFLFHPHWRTGRLTQSFFPEQRHIERPWQDILLLRNGKEKKILYSWHITYSVEALALHWSPS